MKLSNTTDPRKRNMAWFRFYTEALDDPKVQRLHAPLFKTWINLLCLAGKNDGQLPCVDDIAFALRMSHHDASQHIDELVLAGLIDIQTGPHVRFTPHNWAQRQYQSDRSAERTRKYRERKAKNACDVTSDVTVTATVTAPEQNRTDQNRKESESEQSTKKDFDFDFVKKGWAKGQPLERLRDRAEALGLPVDDMMATLERNNPENRSAYFRKLCVRRLQMQLLRMPEERLAGAMNGKVEDWAAVVAALAAEGIQ